MPLAEREINASGRTSRASDTSTIDRGQSRASGTVPKQEKLSSGVLSMLRTDTEMGNVGSFALDSYSTSNTSRGPPPRRGGASSRLSVASSRSTQSNHPISGQGHRPYHSSASMGTRRSRENNAPYYTADTLSPTVMNFPGSSPLIPRAEGPHDGNRSQSLTMSHTSEPAYSLSQHRSMTSMRSLPRPRSSRGQNAYGPPHANRMPETRTNSPAFSNSSGFRPHSRNGPNPGHNAPGFPQQPQPARRKIASDPSLLRDDGRIYLGEGPHVVRRVKEVVGTMRPGAEADVEIPPVPKLLQSRRAELEFASAIRAVDPRVFDPRARDYHRSQRSQKSYKPSSHRSAKGSFSSGSFNHRNDSEPPSSDATTPSTPHGSVSMDRLVGPTGALRIHGSVRMREEPAYYDGSEQFYDDQEANFAPSAFPNPVKPIFEELKSPERMTGKEVAVAEQPMDTIGIAELPASPVLQRITREFVKAALGPALTTDDMDNSEAPTITKSADQGSGNDQDEATTVQTANRANISAALQIPNDKVKRHSIMSQAGSSILESTTLEFAVQSSIPILADNGITMDIDNHTVPVSRPDANSTTEDGISDLLDGYQHTESKHGANESAKEAGSVGEEVEQTSNHIPKTSDGQSFKSCTETRDNVDKVAMDKESKSTRVSYGLPAPDLPFKDSDDRSFKTCKDTVTPDRVPSLPVSRLPSYNRVHSATSESGFPRSIQDRVMPSPLASGANAAFPTSESDLSIFDFKPNNSKFNRVLSSGKSTSSLQHSSTTPVKSSSGKGVIGTLRSVFRGKSQASRMESIVDEKKPEATLVAPTPPPMCKRPSSDGTDAVVGPMIAPTNLSEMEPKQEDVVPHKSSTMADVVPKSDIFQQPSSVYSPNTSSFHGHGQFSPGMSLPQQSPVPSHGNSQTTTHLGLPSRKPVLMNTAVNQYYKPYNDQEDSTTDLKPVYKRYPMSIRNRDKLTNFLPDVQEESHEDSSLNTSASNLKHSSFRFGVASHPDIRAFRISHDTDAFAHGRPSIQSSAPDGIENEQRLPSLNFSRNNLLSGVDFTLRGSRASQSLDLSRELDGGEGAGVEDSELSTKGRSEKYRSLFGGLDTIDSTRANIVQQLIKKHPISPKLREELESLSVPSVDGLTERISEFLPTLKDSNEGEEGKGAAGEAIMAHALEEIHDVGGGPAAKKSNARLRPLPGSPGLHVVEDALYEKLTKTEKEGCEGSLKRELGERGATKGRSWSVAHARPRDNSLPVGTSTELESPSIAVLPTRSLSLGPLHGRFSLESHLSSTSLPHTPTATATRPWLDDKYYTWQKNAPSVEIGLSSRPEPSSLHRRCLSDSTVTTGTLTVDGTSTSPFSPAGAVHTDQQKKALRHSEQQPRVTKLEATSERKGFALAPVHVREGDHSHGAGERYPTSALELPSEVNLLGGESTFSLETNDSIENEAVRKPRFGLKSRRAVKTPGRSEEARIQVLHQSSGVEDPGNLPNRNNRNTFTGIGGMSKFSYWKETAARKIRAFGHKLSQRLHILRRRDQNETPVAHQHLPGATAAQNPNVDGAIGSI